MPTRRTMRWSSRPPAAAGSPSRPRFRRNRSALGLASLFGDPESSAERAAAAAKSLGQPQAVEKLADLAESAGGQGEHAMKMPRNIGPVHFVGIGGIGMSGIAEILHNQGYVVRGSDSAENPNVQRLRDMGIDVEIGQSGREPQGRRGRRHLVGDQEGQSRARRGPRARPAGRAPRRDARRDHAVQELPSPSAARTARRRPRRWSRRCSMPATSTRP